MATYTEDGGSPAAVTWIGQCVVKISRSGGARSWNSTLFFVCDKTLLFSKVSRMVRECGDVYKRRGNILFTIVVLPRNCIFIDVLFVYLLPFWTVNDLVKMFRVKE